MSFIIACVATLSGNQAYANNFTTSLKTLENYDAPVKSDHSRAGMMKEIHTLAQIVHKSDLAPYTIMELCDQARKSNWYKGSTEAEKRQIEKFDRFAAQVVKDNLKELRQTLLNMKEKHSSEDTQSTKNEKLKQVKRILAEANSISSNLRRILTDKTLNVLQQDTLLYEGRGLSEAYGFPQIANDVGTFLRYLDTIKKTAKKLKKELRDQE